MQHVSLGASFMNHSACMHTGHLHLSKGAQSNAGLVVTHDLNISTHSRITKCTVFTNYHINTIKRKKCAIIKNYFDDITERLFYHSTF